MIKLENTEVFGWEAAIRGMRNPMNSWGKTDSMFITTRDPANHAVLCHDINGIYSWKNDGEYDSVYKIKIGQDDHRIMMNLAKAGSVDAKYRRMIVVTVDITAPLYWWKEFDTYKVGTVANSCSTMHKIHAKEFTLEDFSVDHLLTSELVGEMEDIDEDYSEYCCLFLSEIKQDESVEIPINIDSVLYPADIMAATIKMLNTARESYLLTKDKKYWWQMIQLLPSSYNQRRTVMLNYEVLAGIYPKRKDHKLDEWHDFCDWINKLPYSEIITLEDGS